MREQIAISLLGPFRVRIGDDEFGAERFERRASVDLVQLLAASPGHRSPRERVCAALWPDADPALARRRLYKATTRARKAFGSANAITVQAGVLALLPDDDVAVDIDDVEHACLDDPASVRDAIETYRGEFLPDKIYAEWTIPIRRRLAMRHLDLLRSAGQWRTLIELVPSDEQSHVELMKRAIDAGDFRGALHGFRDLERALSEDLGVAPGPEALALRNEARSAIRKMTGVPTHHDATADPSPFARRPPHAQVRIIGRSQEARSAIELLRAHRLVSLTGPGGIGKTHLARHLVHELSTDFGDDVWFCELGSLATRDGLTAELLDVLGVDRHVDTDALASVIRLLHDRAAVLVLDNCEHILGDVRTIVMRLLKQCPQLRIVTTSREALGVASEVVVAVPALTRTSAIELFVSETARRGTPVDSGSPVVDQLCRRLDDLPLAIVLAAARAQTLGVDGVARLLSDRLDALRHVGGGTERHASLRDALAWSLDGLSRIELGVLADVACFADRFTLDGVVAVAGRPGLTEGRILDAFDRLVRRSLIMGPVPESAQPTYRLLESVRVLARERSDDETALQRHLSYFVERVGTSRVLMRDDSNEAIRRYDADWDDIRIARLYAKSTSNEPAISALLGDVAHFVLVTLRFEFLDWCGHLLGREGCFIQTAQDARSLAAWAVLQAYRDDVDQGHALAQQAAAVAPNDDVVLFALGWVRTVGGIDDRGRSAFTRLAADPTTSLCSGALTCLVFMDAGRCDTRPLVGRLRALSDRGTQYRVNYLLAESVQRVVDGNVQGALDALEDCIAIGDEYEHRFTSTGAREFKAFVSVVFCDERRGWLALREALLWPHQHGVWTLAVTALTIAARALINSGDRYVAAMILSGSDRNGFTTRGEEVRTKAIEELQSADPSGFESWWSAGQTLDLRATIAMTIATLDEKLDGRPASVVMS